MGYKLIWIYGLPLLISPIWWVQYLHSKNGWFLKKLGTLLTRALSSSGERELCCLSVPSKKGGNEKDICCIWAIILSHLMSRKIVICNFVRQPSILQKPRKFITAYLGWLAFLQGGIHRETRKNANILEKDLHFLGFLKDYLNMNLLKLYSNWLLCEQNHRSLVC